MKTASKRRKSHKEKTYCNYAFMSQMHVQQKIKFPIFGKRFKLLKFMKVVSDIKRHNKIFMGADDNFSCTQNGVHYNNSTRKFSITHSFN